MKTRDEIDLKDTWDLKPLFSSPEEWEKAFQKAKNLPSLEPFKGHLKDGIDTFVAACQVIYDTCRELEKLYTYAHLYHDVEITAVDAKSKYAQIQTLFQTFQDQRSWFEPEILSLPDDLLKKYLNDPKLGAFRFPTEVIVHLKPHILDAEGEAILAKSDEALSTTYKAYKALTDADIAFPDIKDSQGNTLPLSHGAYGMYLRSPDRTLRKEAFTAFHQSFAQFGNTLGELFQGIIKNHQFHAKTRGYKSCLEAALFPRNIPTQVYDALIDAVRKGIGAHHNYIDLRKKILGVEAFHLYDSYAPLVEGVDVDIPYDEAVDLVIASVALLGKEYQDTLAKGLKSQGWVDRYENKNKRSGAYSSGCYDSHPYILMNYKGTFRDLFTLAHEAGHSMHSYLSKKNQPYPIADYPIFLAEVASTFNEELLFQHLLKNTTDPKKRRYFITQKLDDLRATFFRQTLFAELELQTHKWVEEGIPLTPEKLNAYYRELTEFYFGSSLVFDSFGQVEWSRIPHFYYNFYVYQYATGLSAALQLATAVSEGGESERNRYLKFLSSGGSNYPIPLLKDAGVDLTKGDAVASTLNLFRQLTDDLALECGKC